MVFPFVVFVLSVVQVIDAFDNTRFDNLAVYWGQNSYGATHSDDVANFQKRLSFYCGDDSVIDVFPVAFLNVFFGTGGLPSINLANTCNPTDNATFAGTELPDCSALASDIQTCQSKGKIVTISIGGATGAVGFSSDSQAESFADTVWNLFLGGSSDTRPFGDAVLDGVDLDIEGGGSASYAAFVNRIRSHASGASKTYYVTAAPQCPFPDSALGAVLNSAEFDAVYVQFYNNVCGLNNFNLAQDWDFGLWDNWARTVSPNPNAKVYIGAPASSTAAGQGYVSADTLASIATQMRKSFPSFGGVMLWDASQAVANDRYDVAIKSALTTAGGSGFTFPPCSAPAFVSGTSYTGGSQVSFNGCVGNCEVSPTSVLNDHSYIWQAKFFASSTPANDPNNEWSAISACAGDAVSSSAMSTTITSTSASAKTSSTISSTSTSVKTSLSTSATSSSTISSATSSTTSAPSSGVDCTGIAAWTTGVVYTAGQKVVSGGHLWVANWWTEGDVPNTVNGDWTDEGACASNSVVTATAALNPAVVTASSPDIRSGSRSEASSLINSAGGSATLSAHDVGNSVAVTHSLASVSTSIPEIVSASRAPDPQTADRRSNSRLFRF